ncbi:MAG: HAMP domain-containing protein [Gemmatimonadales bacterium]|nr:HAMP domain-containing protein [Gemmatimonadales bacterium]NIN11041.1 HAMP domain-containing protein [Gemmatimonadales bacterium]NIN49638.1 HAMP domain-containing protein [Gemmatimonadales bacterium]NIP07102.1 HAMP domain-containing protein [Gemmatimonadales bacterium]NIQ99493.1 HAMP domain-containing protein [Gemmatimonadales bacterium]
MYSLRRTLAVRFSLTIFVALLFIALWAYLGAQRVLRRELDRSLAAAAQLQSAALAAGLPIAVHTEPARMDEFIDMVNRFVAVRNAETTVVASNTYLAFDLPLDEASFERALTGEQVWTTQNWGRNRVRSFYGPAPAENRTDEAVVQVSASLRPLAAASREVLFLLLGTVLLGTVATALGAGWLAGSSVAPVEEITQQAEGIQAGPVDQRITAHADVDEFAGLVKVLNGMLQRLDRAFESQRRMIADAGHDLRTPLTAMRGQLEVALRGERHPDAYRSTLNSVLEEVDHLISISDSLVLLARLDAGELALDRVDTDVAAIVDGATGHARARADGREIRFTGPTSDATAAVDAQMLSVVINQLLDNCIKHTPPDTRVQATVTADATDVTVTVEDDGPGLPAEVLPHLFEHFYRSDAARSRTGAAGLGLTVAAAIVDAHGGTIEAAGSALGGLRVTLRLPRTTPAA